MAKTRQQKNSTLTELTDKYGKSKSVVFARYMGLTVNDMHALRRALREQDNEMIIAKKTLIRLMMQQAKLDASTVDSMESGVAVVFGYTDEVAPAKVLANFAKKHEMVGLYGGVLEQRYISAAAVTHLATLPSKQELLAKIVGSLQSPIAGFVNMLGGTMCGFVTVLSKIKEQKAA